MLETSQQAMLIGIFGFIELIIMGLFDLFKGGGKIK
jgi:hypothetical protein